MYFGNLGFFPVTFWVILGHLGSLWIIFPKMTSLEKMTSELSSILNKNVFLDRKKDEKQFPLCSKLFHSNLFCLIRLKTSKSAQISYVRSKKATKILARIRRNNFATFKLWINGHETSWKV